MGLFKRLFGLVDDTTELPISLSEDIGDLDSGLPRTRENTKNIVDDVAGVVKDVINLDFFENEDDDSLF